MYRRYEDVSALEQALLNVQNEYISVYESDPNAGILIDLQIEINELKDRIRFAWDDDAYDNEVIA